MNLLYNGQKSIHFELPKRKRGCPLHVRLREKKNKNQLPGRAIPPFWVFVVFDFRSDEVNMG
jgi:hypothetical protein